MENNAYGNSNAVLLGKIYQLNATVKRISVEKERALEECSALKASCAGIARMYDELKAQLAEKIVQDIPVSDSEQTESDAQTVVSASDERIAMTKSDGKILVNASDNQIAVSEPPFVFFDDNVAVRQRIASSRAMPCEQPSNRTSKRTPGRLLARCLATWRIARPSCRGDTCDTASADLPGQPPPCQTGVNKRPPPC